MDRFFVQKQNINLETNTCIIEGEDVKHISKVLRCKIGEELEICDNDNNEYICEITDIDKSFVSLNILEKVEFDAIKLDKYFIDNILKSRINNEVINFLANVAAITNKNLIIEGVEEKYQVDEIKKLSSNNLFIQGYFYSKPLPIEELKSFIIKAV